MIRQKPTKTIAEAYATTAADNGYRIICNSGSAFEITLHTATGNYNFDLEIDNIGAGSVTVSGQVVGQYQHAHVGNNGGSAWTVVIGGGGSSAFTDLSDVPAAYTGEGGKFVAVKSDVSGLEFVDAPASASGSFDYGLVTDATSTSEDYGGLT